MNERNKFIGMFWRKRYNQGSRTKEVGMGGGLDVFRTVLSKFSRQRFDSITNIGFLLVGAWT